MSDLTRNLLIAAMPQESVRRLEAEARIVEFQVSETIFEPDMEIDVLFPIDGVISIIRALEDGSSVEIAMIGPEGFCGANAALGVAKNPHLGLCQGRGLIARLPPRLVTDEMRREPRVQSILLRFVYAYLGQASQLAACNRLHLVDERLAHWLLLLADRVGQEEMSLTQEFLGRMLATRRAGINEAMSKLKASGCIEHRRKRVRILDREKLEAASCECYRQIIEEFEAALGFAPRVQGRISPID